MTESANNSSFILCPGQGAQSVGMGKAWFDHAPVAAQTFAAADKVLGFELSKVVIVVEEGRFGRAVAVVIGVYLLQTAELVFNFQRAYAWC